MTVDVKVPVLAESVPDATLLEWRKQPGDAVDKDEILIELETDKVVLEVPAPESGVLAEVLKHTGDTVLSQEVLARIEPGAGAPARPLELVPEVAAPSAPSVPSAPSTAAAGPERLSPAVRRLVTEHGLDASAIAGTGRDGRITKADVLAHLEASAAAETVTAPAESASAPETTRVAAGATGATGTVAPSPASPAFAPRRPRPPASNPRPEHRRRGAGPSAASRCRASAAASRSAWSRPSTPPRS